MKRKFTLDWFLSWFPSLITFFIGVGCSIAYDVNPSRDGQFWNYFVGLMFGLAVGMFDMPKFINSKESS